MNERARNSRWSDNSPVVRRGRVVEVVPSERERREILPLLDARMGRSPWAYSILPLDCIHALATAWNRDYLGDRLPLLCRPPNRYLRRPVAQTRNLKANSRFQVFAHADTTLKEDDFWHELMANMVMAQIEIGVKGRAGYQIANFGRILAGPQMPVGGSRSFTITLRIPGKRTPVHVTPDWQPFGIGKETKFRFYFGIESDRGTEPLTTKSHSRKSVRGMLRRYLEMDAQGLPKMLYGLDALYYPIITTSAERVRSMIEMVYELTEGKGHPRFIFNSFPIYNSYESPLTPDGSYFRSTWKRAWSSDYRMDQF